MFNPIVYQMSYSAINQHIDNRADEKTIENIKELDKFISLAYSSWEDYSKLNGIPTIEWFVGSGYRSEQLNTLLGGSEDSPHLKGCAVDIITENQAYWEQMVKWASTFAEECALVNNQKYDSIIIESNGKTKWLHFSLYDFYGNQQMMSYIIKNNNQFTTIIYGQKADMAKKTEVELTTSPIELEYTLNRRVASYEIEGQKGRNQMDTKVMSGSVMRAIYIIDRLMTSFSFSVKQACGVVGNLLYHTNGRLSTNYRLNGKVGICGWNGEQELRFKKIFSDEDSISSSNLQTQTSFLIKELKDTNTYIKVKKCASYNDSCFAYFHGYEHNKDKNFLLTDPSTKKELSLRRSYAKAVYDLYNTYISQYDKNWLVGYYEGNGVNDGEPINPTDDTKLWKSTFNANVLSVEEMQDLYGKVDLEQVERDVEHNQAFLPSEEELFEMEEF